MAARRSAVSALVVGLVLVAAAPANASSSTCRWTPEVWSPFCAVKSDARPRIVGSPFTPPGRRGTPPAGSFSEVGFGSFHACALRSGDGGVACWGSNTSGPGKNASQPASRRSPPERQPHVRAQEARAASASLKGDKQRDKHERGCRPGESLRSAPAAGHTCALKDQTTRSRAGGLNSSGQSTAPAGNLQSDRVNSPATFTTCAVRSEGTVVACWGANGNQQATPTRGTFS